MPASDYALPLRRYATGRPRAFRNSGRPPEAIFSEIHAKEYRGDGEGGREFDSGSGPGSDRIVGACVAAVARIGRRHRFGEVTFVDLGWGDARIGDRLLLHCRRYAGVDVAASQSIGPGVDAGVLCAVLLGPGQIRPAAPSTDTAPPDGDARFHPMGSEATQ